MTSCPVEHAIGATSRWITRPDPPVLTSQSTNGRGSCPKLASSPAGLTPPPSRAGTRPPIAQERVDLRPDGLVRITLKKAYADGTLAVDMDPLVAAQPAGHQRASTSVSGWTSSPVPIPNSDELHVVERFSLDPQTMELTRSYTVEDPVYLKGQGKGQDIVEPADQPHVRDSCKDQQFIDTRSRPRRGNWTERQPTEPLEPQEPKEPFTMSYSRPSVPVFL